MPARMAAKADGGCGGKSGGCDKGGGCGKAGGCGTKADDVPCSAVAPVGDVGSVGVAELDAEHDACSAALERLRASGGEREEARSSLLSVLQAYKAHFKHEEEMLDTHLYADLQPGADGASAPKATGGGFNVAASMRRSHWADHERLIKEVESAIDGAGSSDSGGPLLPIPMRVINSILRSFEQHAQRYDGGYADALTAALRA